MFSVLNKKKFFNNYDFYGFAFVCFCKAKFIFKNLGSAKKKTKTNVNSNNSIEILKSIVNVSIYQIVCEGEECYLTLWNNAFVQHNKHEIEIFFNWK